MGQAERLNGCGAVAPLLNFGFNIKTIYRGLEQNEKWKIFTRL